MGLQEGSSLSRSVQQLQSPKLSGFSSPKKPFFTPLPAQRPRMRLPGKLRSLAPEPACSNVLTPARIPEFCIPPRLPWPYQSESSPLARALPRRYAAEPDLWPCAAEGTTDRTDWDQRPQAAFSLLYLRRARTAYGFCALVESRHTGSKESLLLGDPGATTLLWPPAPRPRAHSYSGDGDGGQGDGACLESRTAKGATPASPQLPRDAVVPALRGRRRLLRVPDWLLSRARVPV